MNLKYSFAVFQKAQNLEIKKVRENEDIVLFHTKAIHSDKAFYRVVFNKHRNMIDNCECQQYKWTRRCSHSLRVLREVKGKEWFWENIKIIEYS